MNPGDMVRLVPGKASLYSYAKLKDIRDDLFVILEVFRDIEPPYMEILHPPSGTRFKCFSGEIERVL